jgi:integrase
MRVRTWPYSTIEEYRTALGSTLRAHRGLDINVDMRISSLMANIARDRIKKRVSIPNWDLALVLLMLTKGPFEPLHQATRKFVTLKTIFLVALASGKRRGELHAIRKDVLHTEGWRSITLLPDTEFVAKTELGNKGSDAIKPIVIPGLTKHLDTSMQEDRSLCPVRAIRFYLKETEQSRRTRRKLFLAYKSGWDDSKEIHANTISTWIKKVILMAYASVSEEDKRLMHVTAHQVRGMAASWALQRNVALESIMAACSWKAHNTFTQYYLKDLALISDEMYHLGPVVVAQHSA